MGFEIVHCKRFSIENFLNWQFLGDLRQRFGQEYFLSPGDDDHEGRLPMGSVLAINANILNLLHFKKLKKSDYILKIMYVGPVMGRNYNQLILS